MIVRKKSLIILLLICLILGMISLSGAYLALPVDVLAQGGGPPADSDGDGFPDDEDNCPFEPGEFEGCPDSDGDGTDDFYDDCPGVPGVPEYFGCPAPPGDGGDGGGDGGGGGTLANPFGGASFSTSLIGFITFILNNIVLPIGAVIAVFFLVFSGFLFVTARGDEERLRLAKKSFLWTVVGIAVLLGSVAIAEGIQATLCQIAPNTPLCQ
jgi:hypothetical protein